MNDKPITPEVEIIENGKPVPAKTIDPSVMQFIMQASATAQLVKLRKLEESKVPVGVKPLKLTVGDTVMEVVLGRPWISFSLYNDGDGALTVWVNDGRDPLVEGMVEEGETYNCDMEFAIIHTLYLKAAPGTTAAVRIYGKEGNQYNAIQYTPRTDEARGGADGLSGKVP